METLSCIFIFMKTSASENPGKCEKGPLLIMMNTSCKNHKLSQRLFYAVIQKPTDKSFWVLSKYIIAAALYNHIFKIESNSLKVLKSPYMLSLTSKCPLMMIQQCLWELWPWGFEVAKVNLSN